MKRFSHLLLAGILGSAFTLGVNSFFTAKENVVKIAQQENVPVSKVLYTKNESGETIPLDFTTAAEKVTHAVVSISSISVSSRGNSEQIPEQFREFFGPFMQPQGETPRVSAGSGVIISEDGYIVTNNHVIENSDELNVKLNDNRTYKATVIGADPTTDIALIKIDETNLPVLSFVPSENVRVGEWVLAVGNPFNLYSTVTAGIVSAKARSIGILRNTGSSGTNESIESFIQTDAAVNPGNSGGALVDLNGGLIGINTAIASTTGSYSGYSFAVPSEIVQKVVEDLLEFGAVQRGWLGVVISNVSDDLAKEYDLKVIRGAYVSDLAENSSAKDAGIKKGDVIVEVDGREIKNNTDVIGYIGQKRPGDKIKLRVDRNGKEVDFDIVLKTRTGSIDPVKIEYDLMTRLGVELEEVEPKMLKRLDLDYGIRVSDILPNGIIATETSMRKGFIITHIGSKPVKNVKDVQNILENTTGGVLIEGRYEQISKTEYYALGLN